VLICDDKKNEAEQLATLMKTSAFDIQTYSFTRGQDAYEYVFSGAEIDACFLDIIMPDLNGVTLAQKLRDSGYHGEIVFLTTSNDFARQSYQVKAFDYLLKPPSPENVKGVLLALVNSKKDTSREGLVIKAKPLTSFILFRNISHVEVIGHIVYVRLKNGEEIKTYATFAEIASRLLCDSRFIQCHRSYIVNMGDIESVTAKEVMMKNGMKVPISRGFSLVKDKMLKWMFEENK